MIPLLMLIILGLSLSMVLHWPLACGFLPGLLGMGLRARARGKGWSDLGRDAFSGVSQIQEILWILILIGMLLPTWTATGLIPYLIQTGSEAIDPRFFYVSAFGITAGISMLLGTTLGSLSVIGISLIGMAHAMHLSVPVAAGALVSGAVVGDRSSPLSGTFNMLASACGISPGEHFRTLLPTGIIGLVLSVVYYARFDLRTPVITHIPPGQPMNDYFVLHPILLLILLALLAAALLRVKIRYVLATGIAVSLLLGIPLQHLSAREIAVYILLGYSGPGPAYLHTDGLAAMLPLVFFVAEIGAFNGILARSGLIEPYVRNVLGSSSNPVLCTIRAAGFGTLLDVLTCNQTLPVIISGSSLLPVWRRHFSPASLGRVVGDSVQVLAALIPWNVMAILSSQMIGVPVLAYAPYAFYIWGLPCITIAYSWLLATRTGQAGSYTPFTG